MAKKFGDYPEKTAPEAADLVLLKDVAGAATKRATVANVLKLMWPVGSVFLSVVSTSPATLLGFGTWVAMAVGKFLVGVDPNDTDFDAAEDTGGEKAHVLTTAEMPSHTHAVTDPGHSHLTQRYPTATGASSGFTADTSMSGTLADNTQPVKSATTGITNQNAGGGGAHNNLPPFCAVYAWKRSA